MARVLVLSVTQNRVYEADCGQLQDFYDNLEAEPFDIAVRKIGDKYFDIFVDDMGLFREERIVSAVDREGNGMLVGNLIFANHDAQGNTTSLSTEDIELIKRNLILAIDENFDTHIVVIADY